MTEQRQHTAVDAIAMSDALRATANRAANMLERLDAENSTMKSATLGVLEDGTPVEDMLAELKETKQQVARLRSLMREVQFHSNCKASERAATYEEVS